MENTTTQKLERSVAYPSITLGDAVEFTSRLREALGKGPYSREEAAKALGHDKLSGPASRKVAALVHYGLLARTGNAYSQTKLAQDILLPLSDEHKNVAIVEAARSPRLFDKLIQRYSGQALPTMLKSVLVREGVSESAANEVVRLFTETLKFSGILVNGVVTSLPEKSAGNNEDIPEVPSSIQSSVSFPPASNSTIQKQAAPSANDFIFEFQNGIKLIIPNNKATSSAIADGELKEVRAALTGFSAKFMQSEEPVDDDLESSEV